MAELTPALDNEVEKDRDFEAFWVLVKDWSEQSRYEIKDEAEARDLLTAISDAQHGVLQWIRRHW